MTHKNLRDCIDDDRNNIHKIIHSKYIKYWSMLNVKCINVSLKLLYSEYLIKK